MCFVSRDLWVSESEIYGLHIEITDQDMLNHVCGVPIAVKGPLLLTFLQLRQKRL